MNEDYQKLETARRRMIEDNQPWLDCEGIDVQYRIENNPKYGWQLIIIVKPEESEK